MPKVGSFADAHKGVATSLNGRSEMDLGITDEYCRLRFSKFCYYGWRAGVAELADAPDLGSGGISVKVQVLSPAPIPSLKSFFVLFRRLSTRDVRFSPMTKEFQRKMHFFYSQEESAWRFCRKKLKKAYPFAHYKLVSGYGHVGYPGEHLEEYCGWLSLIAIGK